MDKLDFRTRIDLSNLLDVRAEGKDVFALAEKLGFGNLRNVLDGMETSPTRFLLDYYEASDGTVAQLKESLRNIHRGDAVSVLEKNTKGRSHAQIFIFLYLISVLIIKELLFYNKTHNNIVLLMVILVLEIFLLKTHTLMEMN